VRQFYPVSPVVYRQLLAAKPMYLFLNQMLQAPRIRFEYVRTERKRVIMMAGIACELLGRDLTKGGALVRYADLNEAAGAADAPRGHAQPSSFLNATAVAWVPS